MEFGTGKGALEGTPQNAQINQPAQDFIKSVEWHDRNDDGVDDKVTTYESGKVCVDYYVPAASVASMGEDKWGFQGNGHDRTFFTHTGCDE